MLTKVLVVLSVLVFYTALASRPQEHAAIDCSILSECDGNWECIEFLASLYRLDCFAGTAAKKSFGGGKRGGLKNLEKIFLGSYMTRMR
ncbi:unnamed protein product [Caenorhabditis sp. 36 PRJEB53466]|nr:unnamed protein product [Caenorhabditis sp. 36 PRJEB53466]